LVKEKVANGAIRAVAHEAQLLQKTTEKGPVDKVNNYF
tara:strand:+ start:1573 stop:1686 length:114 start_codon:yes stop_codon:yes gene_type:complete